MAVAASRVTTTRRRSAAERRAQYLEVATALVTEHGADAVTMEAVAAGANVNKALLYRQFSNRSELLLALFQQETQALDSRVLAAMDAADGFEGKLRAWVHAWFAYMGRQGTLYYRLLDAARTVASSAASSPNRERQRRLIVFHGNWYAEEYGIATDEAHDIAAVLIAGLSGAIDRWVGSPGAATRRRLEETYVQMVLGSLERVSSASNGSARKRAASKGNR